MGIRGVGKSNIDYVMRILKGEDVSAVAADVPERRNYGERQPRANYPDRDNWNGSWDNTVRRIEDD